MLRQVLAGPHIDQLQIAITAYDDVLGFQVAIDDTIVVQIL